MIRDRPHNFPLIRLEQVSISASVGSLYLLEHISLTVSRGDRIAIIGPSGAGKTSLLRLLNRLVEPTRGNIYLQGQPLAQIPPMQLRQQVVLVPQEAKLLGMTVKETLAYPLHLQKLPQTEIQQRLQRWTSRLFIPEDWLDRHELQLSLGQRQLVAIARALVMQPQVLLLDEPTSALDVGTASNLLQVLTQLGQSQETTILMVNHQLELVQQFAQRVLYLHQGRLRQDYQATELDWEMLREQLVFSEAKTASDWS
jgi:D-methionine transport system ATP-binding protein